MARKGAKDAAKKKAAKQKKILIVLVLVLVGVLVFAFMTLMHGSPAPGTAAPAGETTPGGATSAGQPIAVVTPGIEAPPVGSLHTFTKLGQKDPFHDGGPDATKKSDTTTTPTTTPTSKGSGSGSTSKQPSAPLTNAVISVNGKQRAIDLGAKFVQAPGLSGVALFRLVKVTRKTAVIAVVGTQQHFTLYVRRPLVLAQAGGWTYTLILEPAGSPTTMTVQPTIHDQTP